MRSTPTLLLFRILIQGKTKVSEDGKISLLPGPSLGVSLMVNNISFLSIGNVQSLHG